MNSNPPPNVFPVLPPSESPLQVPTPNLLGSAEKKLTSRYRGVCWNRKNRRWQAAINRAGQYIYLGSFVSEEDAAKAFDRAAVKLRGHSTKINFDFADYEEELKWHEQTSRAGGTTDAILKDPKMLRGTTNEKTGFTNVSLTPPIRRQPLPAHFPNAPMDAAGFTQVITQQQTQRLSMSVPFQPYFPAPQMMGMNRAGFLPQVMPSSNALFPGMGSLDLSQPPVRASTNQNPTKVPPPGATQTQFFHGAGNAFALAYAKNNSPGISVLVFDGHVMNDNGVFSTMEDAAQACKSLLSIIEKMQNHEQVIPETHAKLPIPTPPPPPQPRPNPPVQADSLPAKSPFEVRPGKAPESIQTDNSDQKWFPHDAQPGPGTTRTSFPNKSTTSIQEQMGSLLNMSNNQFENLAKGAVVTTAPVQTGETRQETRMSFSAASVSLLSRSLEDLVCVLNQSGQLGSANSGSIKREGDDVAENGQTPLTTPSAIDLRLEEKSLTLNGPPMSIAPFVYGLQNNTEEVGQMQNPGQGPMLGKRKMDTVQDNENAKKAREG